MREGYRLTTKDIAMAAWDLSDKFGQYLGIQSDVLYSEEQAPMYEEQVHRILMEASNPNQVAILSKMHDKEVSAKLKDGWRYGPELSTDEKVHPMLLPFSELPEEEQAKAIFFRTTVISFMKFWAGY